MRKLFATLLMAVTLLPASAQDDSELGMWLSAAGQKKINKQWNVTAEAEYRLRENLGSTDRWTVSLGTAYKPVKWLKLDAGYKFMRVLNDDKSTMKTDGVSLYRWAPAYWNTRHRLWASATATLPLGRLDLSLRERWQYTYRPSTTYERYDFDDDEWEDKTRKGAAKHVVRSRLMAEYDIRHCKVDPFASVELYNAAGGLEKIRYTFGAEWKISKKQGLEFFYRYVDSHDDDETNLHVIGLGYKYKF